MCMSPNEMSMPELEKLIATYEKWGKESGYSRYFDRAAKLRELLAERTEAGTLDVVPVVTPRHYVGVQQDQATAV